MDKNQVKCFSKEEKKEMLESESLFGWERETKSCTKSGGKQSAGFFMLSMPTSLMSATH